jgi:hypothetical protein
VSIAPHGAGRLLTEELGQHRAHLPTELVAVQGAAEGEFANPAEVDSEALTNRTLDRSLNERSVLMLGLGA